VKLNGAYVRALATTTPSSLLESICKELGIGKRATLVATVEDIVRRLAETGRPLFIDEADYLVDKRRLIETLRDIHDLATVPVVLIGMHGFRRKITHLQQLTGRIAQWVEFEPASADDAALLARELAEVDIADDLVRKLHESARGSIRLIVVGLNRIEQFARARSLNKIGLHAWPANQDFFVGTAPAKKNASLAAVS
jgi:DNA transposition AAA+ family ATPase